MKHIANLLQVITKHKHIVIVSLFAIIVASWLMFSTFSYKNSSYLIDSKLWGDFLGHVPLIRSFSEGDNFPPEYPIYAGEPIRYHFLFYAMVGMLVRAGISIDWALNTLSMIGFAGLLICIYLIAQKITRSKVAGWLSIAFFLFNSSLQWVYFYQKNKGSDLFSVLIHQKEFATFGPWSNEALSIFWNMNIYTNQRHLAFSFLVMFVGVWAVYYSKLKRGWLITAIVIGVLAFMHKALLMVLFCILGFHFLIRSDKRPALLMAVGGGILLAIPGLKYLNGPGGTSEKTFGWHPGFMYQATTWKEFPNLKNPWLQWLMYWLINASVLPVLALTGFILRLVKSETASNSYSSSGKNIFKNPRLLKLWDMFFNEQTVWFWSATAIFAIANLYTFSIDIAANHKLVNYSMIIWGIYAAYLIVVLFRKQIFHKIIAVLFTVLMVLGGIVDIFPIINDQPVVWQDAPLILTSQWIEQNTNTDDSFFNATYEVAPVLFTGRKTTWGWDYLIWSMGYNVEERKLEMQKILTGQSSLESACLYLQSKKVDYIYEDGSVNFLDKDVNHDYFSKTFVKVSPDNLGVNIYSVSESCRSNSND